MKMYPIGAAPASNNQSNERKNIRLSAVASLSSAAALSKTLEFNTLAKIISDFHGSMFTVHEAFNSTTAKLSIVTRDASSIYAFFDSMFAKLFSSDPNHQEGVVYILALHEFLFEKKFFRGVREGTIQNILQGASIFIFVTFISHLYKYQDKAQLMKIFAKSGLVDVAENVSKCKDFTGAIRTIKSFVASAQNVKPNNILKGVNLSYFAYSLVLSVAVSSIEVALNKKGNLPAPVSQGIECLSSVYLDIVTEVLTTDSDLREVAFFPQPVVVDSQIALKSIPESTDYRKYKMGFATLQYLLSPTEFNYAILVENYKSFSVKDYIPKVIEYAKFASLRTILQQIKAVYPNMSREEEDLLHLLSANVQDPNKCLLILKSKAEERALYLTNKGMAKSNDELLLFISKVSNSIKNAGDMLDPSVKKVKKQLSETSELYNQVGKDLASMQVHTNAAVGQLVQLGSYSDVVQELINT